ncbi:MAG: disulfide bond formation protein B [Hyphomonadaceae bacterium]|nr:disulfide bond formation protein B [Hyphomonadaceae bacterium]
MSKILPGLSTTAWLVLAFVLSGALLAGALFFEHVLGYHPCQMCYWQRDAHKAVMIVTALGLAYRYFTKTDKYDRVLLLFAGVAFAVSFAIAFWHMGVEYKWWDGPKSCSAPTGPSAINPNDIFDALNGKAKLPQCNEAPWHLLGISMAGYNALISGIAALIGLRLAAKGTVDEQPSAQSRWSA